MFGLAVLTRGLIGVLFPLAVLVIFVSATNGWHRWRELKLVSSALVFLAIAAPWHVFAELRAPGFLWAYFVNDHLRRALGTRWPPDYSALPLWMWLSAHIIWMLARPTAAATPKVAATNQKATTATHSTGQPNQTCGSPTAPETPGHAASATGSAFDSNGKAGTVYAGTQPQNSKNPTSVAQYDVACSHQK